MSARITANAIRCSLTTSSQQDARTRAAFHDLAAQAKVQTTLHLGRSVQASMGLLTSERAAAGSVLMRVPQSAAIVVDYNAGLLLPASARWPRLRGAASETSEPLPWDILQACALMDGLAGDGGEFWEGYCDALLPAPEQLTLPMCWGAPRLAQLQHEDIARAAEAQQARLAGIFPELMEPLAPDVPSWLQWAFACVRSRSFRAGPDAFAFVPFLDFANHADAPTATPPAPSPGRQQPDANGASAGGTANADFRVAPPDANGGGSGKCFELVALRDILPGEEVTICYSGSEGYTNQRYMAQYGFVPHGGNPADRIKLDLGPELQAAPLELARLQDLMGDALFLAALRGTDPYLTAALRSLPLRDNEDGDPRVVGVSGQGVNGGGSGGGGNASVRTAEALLMQVHAQIAEGTTPLEADEAMLVGAAGDELWAADPRLAAAVRYRVERKRLLAKGAALLRAYVRGSSPH